MYKKIISIILIVTIMLTTTDLTGIKKVEAATSSTNNSTSSSTFFDFQKVQDSVKSTLDTDNDGVYDEVERIIGTSAEYKDTDGDGLDDYFELKNGLSPLKSDTNDDGVDDLYEITKGEDIKPNINLDTDRDGVANILDDDNDNDGVVDYIDISPFSVINKADSKVIDIATSGHRTFVTVQLRPEDVENIIKYNRAITWPEDYVGQIRNIDADYDNIKITPYLKIRYDYSSSYPDKKELLQYGYLKKDKDLYIPLQKLESNGQCVGYQATIYIPKKGGNKIYEGFYTNVMTLELSYMMTMKNDYLNQNIHKKSSVLGILESSKSTKKVTVTGFDELREKQFLNTSVGDLNNNGRPDFAIFYVLHDDVKEGIVNITYDVYYDLNENMKSGSYGKTGLKFPIETGFKYTNKDDEGVYTYLSRFDMQIVNGEICAFYYDGKEKATVYTAGGYGNKNTGIKIDNGSRNYFNTKKNKEFIGSKIYDTAGYYDKKTDTYFYLYTTENKETNSDHWDNTYLAIKQGNQKQKDILVDFKSNVPKLKHEIINTLFADMTSSCALEIYDVNSDGKEDLVLLTYRYNTDVDGKFESDLYYMSDIYGPGLKKYWENIKKPPMDFNSNKVFARSMDLFDFNQDGLMDMVFVEAKKDIDSVKTKKKPTGYNMDLSFDLSVSYGIGSREEIFMTNEVPFKITGLQVETQHEIKANIYYNSSNDVMLGVTEAMEYEFVNSSKEINDAISTTVKNLQADHLESCLNNSRFSTYDEAVMEIGRFFNLKKKKHQNSIGAYLLALQKKTQYYNLDEIKVSPNQRVVAMNVKKVPLLTLKELSLKWLINGELASPQGLTNMIELNKNNINYFNEYRNHAKDNLSRLNIGITRITQIADKKIQGNDIEYEKDGGNPVYLGTKYPASGVSGYIFVSKHTSLVTKTKIVEPSIISNSYGKFFSSSADKAMASKYAKFAKIGKIATGVGLFIDVAFSVYSGVLYGQMLQEKGASKGLRTGATITYISLYSAKAVLLTCCVSGALGPIGYGIFALVMVDMLLDFFIEDYDSLVDKWLEGAVKHFYDIKHHEGTYVSDLDIVDKRIFKDSYFTWVNDIYREETDYTTMVSAASKKTPANKKSKVDSCWVKVYDVLACDSALVDNDRSYSEQKLFKKDDIWNVKREFYFNNKIEFNNPGRNILVNNDVTYKYKIIKYVKEEKKIDPKFEKGHLIIRDKEYTYYYSNGNKIHDLNNRRLYFDVLPTTFEAFFDYFELVDVDKIIKNNQLGCRDIDGDGLLVNDKGQEVKADGTVLKSDPNKYDTDNDGLSDYLEAVYNSDPNSDDTDKDKLKDYEEFILGTNLNDKDTDKDGLSDYIEVTKPVTFKLYDSVIAEGYSNPLFADTDGDYVSDLEESKNRTNPASKFTYGGDLYDGNKYIPQVTTPFEEYYSLVNGQELIIDLNNHITDEDDSSLVFLTNYGAVDENGVLTYIYNKEEHGTTFEITIIASDSKCGILENKIIVCDDTDSPFLTGVSLDGVVSDSIEAIKEKAKSTSSFAVEFNENVLLESKEAISIVPIYNEHFDKNEAGKKLSTNCEVTIIEETPNTIIISRENQLIENNITYEINIAKEALTDINGNMLKDDYKITFSTIDTIAPKLVSVTDTVGVDSPLILEFNEPVIQKSSRCSSVRVLNNGDCYKLHGNTIKNTYVVNIKPNQLKSNEIYVLDNNLNMLWDLNDNVFEGFDNIDINEKSFKTTDVEGLQCTLDQFTLDSPFVQSYNYCYETNIKNGEIEITFNEEIKEGVDFNSIALSYENNLYFYGCDTAATFIKDTAAEFTLPYTARIEGKSLFIKPDNYDDNMNYSVFIEEKSLTDLSGSYLKNMVDGLYRVRVLARSGVPSTVKAEKTDIVALVSLSQDMSDVNIVAKGFNDTAYPSQIINIMLNEEAESSGSIYTLKQAITIRDEDNKKIPISSVSIDKGIMMVRLISPLMPNSSYVINIKAGALKSDNNGKSQEITFSFNVNDELNLSFNNLKEILAKINEKLGLGDELTKNIPDLGDVKIPDFNIGDLSGQVPDKIPNSVPRGF